MESNEKTVYIPLKNDCIISGGKMALKTAICTRMWILYPGLMISKIFTNEKT